MTVPALLVLLAGAATAQQAGLRGEAGYREVRLHWTGLAGAAGVRWCEHQSWGEEHHCRRSVLPPPRPRQINFTTEIRGLKMATNYTFELFGPGRVPRRLGQPLVLPTRGFSARATGCARDRTTVQLDTGPDFSGKISAEGREAECSMDGAGRGGNTSYQFIIEHARCGSQQNSSSVWTYVVVQEAGAILTHSTRRFLVLCHFTLPEVFTVQAGFAMPGSGAAPARVPRKLPGESRPAPPRIITAASLEEARLAHLLSAAGPSAWESRTLTSNLFGGRSVGEEGGEAASPALLALLLSAGLATIAIVLVLVLVRPRKKHQSTADSRVDMKTKKKYRPRESKA